MKFLHIEKLALDDLPEAIETKKSDLAQKEEEILSSKLAPDMFDFKRQVQVFTDNAAGGIARGAQMEKISLPDTETTIDELIQKLSRYIQMYQ